MTPDHRRRPLRVAFRLHVGAVLALGAAGWVAAVGGLGAVRGWDEPALWFLVLVVVAGQFRGVVYNGEDGRTDFAFTVPFTFALFLLYGPAVAIVVDGGGQALSEIVRRKPPVKVAYNAALTALAYHLLTLAFAAFRLEPGLPHMPGPGYLLVFMAGAVASLLVVHLAVSMVIALSQGLTPRSWINRGLLLANVTSSALLVPLSLLIAAAAERSAWLMPVAALPVLIAEVVSVDLTRRRFEATHDPDTGLLNRRGLVERLAERSDDGPHTVLYVRLSGLDELAESLSPDRVDDLRNEVVRRLGDLVDDDGLIGRVGDDALALILPGQPHGIEALMARRLTEPFAIDELHLAVETTIGVAKAPDHGTDPERLLVRAKAAAYAAARQEIHTAEYCTGIEDEQQDRLSLIAEVRRALQDDELELHYQPRVCLHTGRTLGFEALLRWQHPERGMVPPDEFIPAVEQTLLIDDVTRWVLRTALEQLSAWRAAGYDYQMAVNIAAHNLLDESFVDVVAGMLAANGVPPALLELELTERSVAADVARTERTLDQLHELGVRLSLDDFGTGYSSMAQLRTLPVDMVKIDRSFVMPLTRGSSDAMLVAAMVGLAASLRLEIVAEGVETDEGLAILSELGCDSGQGYYFSRPLPAAAVVPWLEAFHSPAALPEVPARIS